jgi:hypothetical protein
MYVGRQPLSLFSMPNSKNALVCSLSADVTQFCIAAASLVTDKCFIPLQCNVVLGKMMRDMYCVVYSTYTGCTKSPGAVLRGYISRTSGTTEIA